MHDIKDTTFWKKEVRFSEKIGRISRPPRAGLVCIIIVLF